MNRNLILAVILGIAGIVLIGYSVASGEGNAGIILFIPVFYGSGLFAFMGVLCIMAAMILGFIGFAERMVEQEGNEPRSAQSTAPRIQKSVKGGGVVLIGPIPIIFGSDAKTTIVLVVLALIVMVAAIILIYMSLL
ncbi:MAG: DUF131 domain-containing protein [Methanomassiliicoccales archaeon]|nr:MAG: DUF131 domain-containing protein [Methanomassiliicoccales archaeon]